MESQPKQIERLGGRGGGRHALYVCGQHFVLIQVSLCPLSRCENASVVCVFLRLCMIACHASTSQTQSLVQDTFPLKCMYLLAPCRCLLVCHAGLWSKGMKGRIFGRHSDQANYSSLSASPMVIAHCHNTPLSTWAAVCLFIKTVKAGCSAWCCFNVIHMHICESLDSNRWDVPPNVLRKLALESDVFFLLLLISFK